MRLIFPYCDVAATDKCGWTAPMYVAGDIDCVRLLLPGSDPNAMSNDPNAMHSARDANALMHALTRNSREVAKLLIPLTDCDRTNWYGDNALIVATQYGPIDCVRVLATPDAARIVDDEGMTALMHALCEENADFCRVLFPVSDLYQKGGDGVSARDEAKSLEGSVGRLSSISN